MNLTKVDSLPFVILERKEGGRIMAESTCKAVLSAQDNKHKYDIQEGARHTDSLLDPTKKAVLIWCTYLGGGAVIPR